MLLADERAQIVECCLRMQRAGLTVGTSGNVSIRVGEHIAITPRGLPYDELTPATVCVVDLDGLRVDGPLAPSTEVPMHTVVYAHTDARAVVHTHPLYATALSTVLDELPPIHYMVAQLGGPVRVAPYATFGTPELAEHTRVALAGRSAVILRNHGATTYGPTLRTAYSRSELLEWLCRLYHQARLLAEPSLIDGDELARVAELFEGYGPR